MTIVDFYEIISETPKTLMIEQVGSTVVADEAYLAGRVVPNTEVRTGKIYRAYKRPDANGKMWYVSSLDKHGRHHLRPFDGKPQYFNHCD